MFTNILWWIAAATVGFYAGYHYPRDVEIESTQPIVFHYEITPEAARLLVFKREEDRGARP